MQLPSNNLKKYLFQKKYDDKPLFINQKEIVQKIIESKKTNLKLESLASFLSKILRGDRKLTSSIKNIIFQLIEERVGSGDVEKIQKEFVDNYNQLRQKIDNELQRSKIDKFFQMDLPELNTLSIEEIKDGYITKLNRKSKSFIRKEELESHVNSHVNGLKKDCFLFIRKI